MSEKKKRNIIIGVLCTVLLLMVVGYAAFSSILNITGTSNISSNWDVEITKIERTSYKGATDNEGSPSYDNTNGLSATFNTSFTTPGDYATYKIEITNKGSLDAILKNITIPENTNNDIVFYLNKDQNNGDISDVLTQNSTLTKSTETGNVGYVYVTVLYKDYEGQKTPAEGNNIANMTITFDFEQVDGNFDVTPDGNTVNVKGVDIKLAETGDGLYEDTTETGRYIYKGSAPNNYITFNNELWRIMSVESDGTLKIIRNESIGNIIWDATGTRNSSTSTYCTNASSFGCNAWASTSNLVNTPSEFTLHYPNGNPTSDTTTYSGTVTQDASLNTYLNGAYLETINEDSKYITTHDFNVGTPGDKSDTEEIATDVQQEALYKWNGKIGLMTVTEVLKTTTDTGCASLKVGNNNGSKSVCSNNNWIWPTSGYLWTISPSVDSDRDYVWSVKSSGYVFNGDAGLSDFNVLPAVYLTSNITLSGEGTSSNPYIIQ